MTTYLATPAARAIALSKKAACVAIGAAAFSLVSLNAAAVSVDPPRQKVDFGDLDLSKRADTERLYRRLRIASEQVCGIWNRSTTRVAPARKQCAATALSNAVNDVGNPALLALHNAKTDMKLADRETKGSTKG